MEKYCLIQMNEHFKVSRFILSKCLYLYAFIVIKFSVMIFFLLLGHVSLRFIKYFATLLKTICSLSVYYRKNKIVKENTDESHPPKPQQL